MSLNGDTYVMRNGRSTSEISVYNYPEHLNPFYEDDQHKRLRFWHINKKGTNENRRSSFSNAIKDMWAFKSFRLKKKSSTLGINKTSESPPPLRRDFQYTNNGLYTCDPRQRYTSNGSAPATLNGNFLRNATYRSSLQNMNSSQGFGFNRNDQYRSTVQATGASRNSHQTLTAPGQSNRYVYAGSVTPQPLRNSGYRSMESRETMARGISQNSVNSTNPFEDDDDENNETISIGEKSVTSNSLSPKRPGHRKKRRAPAPPVPVHSMSKDSHKLPNESSQTTKECNVNELHINEEDVHTQENLDISNLTAEIENFVKAVNDGPSEPIKPTTTTISSTTKVTSKDESKTIQPAIANGVVKIEEVKVSPPKVTVKELVNDTLVPSQTKKYIAQEQNQITQEAPTTASIKITKQTVEEKVIKKEATTKYQTDYNENLEGNVIEKSKEPIIVSTHQTTIRQSTPKMPIRGILKKPTIENENPSEVGHLECIHVHIDRTETIPDSTSNRTSSFKDSSKPNTKPLLKPKPEVRKLENLPSPDRERKQLEQTSNTNVMYENRGILSGTATTDVTTATVNPLRIEETPPNTPLKTTPTTTIPTVSSEQDPEIVITSHSSSSTVPLKIVESKEIVREVTQNRIKNSPASSPVALRRSSNDEFKPKSSSQFEWKQSTLAPLEPNIPPEKRKSVKDIIASINRSQRLLNAAAHKDPPMASLTILPDNPSLDPEYNEFRTADAHTTPLPLRKYSEPNNINRTHQFNEENNHHRVTQRRSYNNCIDSAAACAAPPSYEESQKLDNAEILRKGQVTKQVYDYRESSPTTSNLDWNPVPKPKRTKNLQEL